MIKPMFCPACEEAPCVCGTIAEIRKNMEQPEESQAPPANALSLAADGMAEALRQYITDINCGCEKCRKTRKALATYEAAKESR